MVCLRLLAASWLRGALLYSRQAHCAACCFDVLLVLTGSLYDVLPVLVGCVPYGVMFRLVAIFGREYVKFVVRGVVSV